MRKVLCTLFILLSASSFVAAQPEEIALHPDPAERSVFRDGDLLQSAEGGLVRWVRNGRLIATLIDKEGLLSAEGRLADSARLYILDAIGQQANLVHPIGDLFLSATAPRRIFWQRGHTPRTGGAQAKTVYGDMLWWNGDVLANNTTRAIFWGPQWTNPSFAGDKISGLDQFFGGFGFSLYANTLTEYYGSPSGGLYGASQYLGHVIDTSSPPSNALTVGGAISEVCQITGNQPDPNALYLIYTSNGPGAGLSYCAWHSWGNCNNGAPVQVAYMPNIDGIAGCDPHDTWTTHSQGLAALANVSAHELSEAITDPRGGGWYDNGFNENADKCAWSFHNVVWLANGFPWKLQMNWSNRAFDGWTGYPNVYGQRGCLQ